jgi:hypothetical protein
MNGGLVKVSSKADQLISYRITSSKGMADGRARLCAVYSASMVGVAMLVWILDVRIDNYFYQETVPCQLRVEHKHHKTPSHDSQATLHNNQIATIKLYLWLATLLISQETILLPIPVRSRRIRPSTRSQSPRQELVFHCLLGCACR